MKVPTAYLEGFLFPAFLTEDIPKKAVKKLMGIEQKPVYDFLKNHRSPFIPEIYENVEKGQQLVVIEEYIEGRNLEDILYVIR